jgi:predicted nucleic acid-binding protein
VLAEVDYWVHVRMHPGVFVTLLDDIVAGAYHVEELKTEDYRRIRELVDRYGDADVGFVDAAVFAVVERLSEPKLATLDLHHFRLLRPRHVDALRLLPEEQAR